MQFYKLVTGLLVVIAATATTQSTAFSAQPFQNSTHPTLEEVSKQIPSAPSARNPQSSSSWSRFDDSSLSSDDVAALQPVRNSNVIPKATVLPATQFTNPTRPILSELGTLNR